MNGGGDLDSTMQIRGGTDQTVIGNVSDRLLVSAAIQNATTATYSASNIFTLANNATDVFTISGSATKTVKIYRVLFYLTATTGSNATIKGIIRTTANTGGTSTVRPNISFDSSNAAATAVVRSYTANPSALGTSAGDALTFGVYVSGGGTIGSIPFSLLIENTTQPVVLRGVNQLFAVNMNSVTFAGNSARATVVWTEE